MKKEIKSIVIKIVVFIAIVIILSIIIGSFEPLINNDVAMQQMNGEDYGFSQLIFYNKLKNYSVYGYILLFFIMFITNIIRVIKLIVSKFKSN